MAGQHLKLFVLMSVNSKRSGIKFQFYSIFLNKETRASNLAFNFLFSRLTKTPAQIFVDSSLSFSFEFDETFLHFSLHFLHSTFITFELFDIYLNSWGLLTYLWLYKTNQKITLQVAGYALSKTVLEHSSAMVVLCLCTSHWPAVCLRGSIWDFF